MTTSFERHLRQEVTYWAPLGTDVYGATSYDAPVTVVGRWEDKVQMVRNSKGQEVVSNSRVFFAISILADGMLYLGESVVADPRTVEGANEIRATSSVPDLRNLKTLYVAYL